MSEPDPSRMYCFEVVMKSAADHAKADRKFKRIATDLPIRFPTVTVHNVLDALLILVCEVSDDDHLSKANEVVAYYDLFLIPPSPEPSFTAS